MIGILIILKLTRKSTKLKCSEFSTQENREIKMQRKKYSSIVFVSCQLRVYIKVFNVNLGYGQLVVKTVLRFMVKLLPF